MRDVSAGVVPTVADARRAAGVLLAEGAEEVLLYGSVARGEATAKSDIDLVAVFADIDYDERYKLKKRLEEAAAGAVAERWRVQVFPTDRPEWKTRVEQVSTSFEHRINALGTVTVADSGRRGEVRWNKKMQRATSNAGQAFGYWRMLLIFGVNRLEFHLNAEDLWADRTESGETNYGPRNEPAPGRLVDVCAAAAIAFDRAVETLAVLHGAHTTDKNAWRGQCHDITNCVNLLPPDLRSTVADKLDELNIDLAAMAGWFEWDEEGWYASEDIELLDAAACQAESYVTAAVEMLDMLDAALLDALGEDREVIRYYSEKWRKHRARLVTLDVRTGQTRSFT